MSTGQLSLHCNCTPVYETEYEPGSDAPPSRAVVEAVAAAEGVDPVDLAPLHDSVEPDALDRLFDRRGEAGTAAVVVFSVDRWNVFVHGDGRVLVCDAEQPAETAPVFDRTDDRADA